MSENDSHARGFLESIGITPIPPQKLRQECPCCSGETEGVGWPCAGCEAALRSGDRTAHPHELSAAQQAVIARDPGGTSEVQDVMVLAADDPEGGPPTLLGYTEKYSVGPNSPEVRRMLGLED